MLSIGDVVKVIRIVPEDAIVAEHTRCWLGATGTITSAPARDEVWVEFPATCDRHGATGAVFREDELEKQTSA